ncbi:hypothetical protein JI752_000065 [Lysobacter sp. MMG2]|uniref:hypothetical protein n=1 Tax=Lysobacter sp. MMG2 TaxID=2801338 RepID=UPI001C21586C|nr:hypothetical protein [Lysobacter sp. MMG2]MBU8974523.1 hypothetical protein [Lysobacter sp. MMG2]
MNLATEGDAMTFVNSLKNASPGRIGPSRDREHRFFRFCADAVSTKAAAVKSQAWVVR